MIKKEKKKKKQRSSEKAETPQAPEKPAVKDETVYEPVEKVNFELNPELFIGSIECIKLEKKMLAHEYEQPWDVTDYETFVS